MTTKNICFIDSVCWIAILNADDELHEKADTEYKKLMKFGFRLVTSTAVLNEVANALCKPKYRGSVVEFYKKLQKFQRIEIAFVDEKLWSSGWEFFEKRPDKEWSLTDCISMVIMQEHGSNDALTNDKHFEQAVSTLFCENKNEGNA